MLKRIVAPLIALLAVVTGFALAHATVKTDMGLSESKAGGFETYRLQVPTERPVETTGVKLFVPEGLTVSRFQVLPGFERSVEKNSAGLITTVTWKGKVASDEFVRFAFSAKNPAQPTKLLFKVHQTYANGEVVKWEDSDPKGKTPASQVEIK
jgi:uncharacterized protein YcnI